MPINIQPLWISYLYLLFFNWYYTVYHNTTYIYGLKSTWVNPQTFAYLYYKISHENSRRQSNKISLYSSGCTYLL